MPIDRLAMSNLISKPIVVRIVTIVDITSLSILELFEYGLTLKDINFSPNGIIAYEKETTRISNGETALGISLTGD